MWALPVAALAAVVVFVVATSLAVTRAVEPDDAPPAGPSTTAAPPGAPLAATTRPPGSCVRTDVDDTDPRDPVPVPRAVPCGQPHDVEVLAVLPAHLADPDAACADLAAALGVPAAPSPAFSHRTGTVPIAPRSGDRQLTDQVVVECLLLSGPVTGSVAAGGFTDLEPAGP